MTMHIVPSPPHDVVSKIAGLLFCTGRVQGGEDA